MGVLTWSVVNSSHHHRLLQTVEVLPTDYDCILAITKGGEAVSGVFNKRKQCIVTKINNQPVDWGEIDRWVTDICISVRPKIEGTFSLLEKLAKSKTPLDAQNLFCVLKGTYKIVGGRFNKTKSAIITPFNEIEYSRIDSHLYADDIPNVDLDEINYLEFKYKNGNREILLINGSYGYLDGSSMSKKDAEPFFDRKIRMISASEFRANAAICNTATIRIEE